MVDFVVLLGMASAYDAARYKVERCEDVYGSGSERCDPERDVAEQLRGRVEEDWYDTIREVARSVAEDEMDTHKDNYHRRYGDYD